MCVWCMSTGNDEGVYLYVCVGGVGWGGGCMSENVCCKDGCG